ncbi:MAG: hypothetical protein M3347_03150 [Armatimonadota bacterium]|nr:hypothetical protein [Armatimonadota bacterium]
MSAIHLTSTEALLALETSLGQSAQTLESVVEVARARASAMLERLEAQQMRCKSEVRYWQDRIASADEDEDTGPYYEELEAWQAKLELTRRTRARLEDASHGAQSRFRQMESLAEESTPKAREFLRRRVSEIEDYTALKADDGGSGAAPGAGGSAMRSGTSSTPFNTGYRRARRDPRDWLWSKLYGPPPPGLPERANLESFGGPPSDQKTTPQCVCHSLAALKHHDEYCSGGAWLSFDPEPIYQDCKARDGCPDKDGTTIRDAFKVAVKSGLTAHDGTRCFVRGYARLESAEEICHALSLGKVVMLGLQIAGAQLSALSRGAVVSPPDAPDGGHCMLVVGYDLSQRMFRVRNSWGHGWADAGHCWIPFSYLLSDPEFDAWTSVCDKVEGEPQAKNEGEGESAKPPGPPDREVSMSSNFAWFDPQDVVLESDDGPALEWTRISPEAAAETLATVARMRAFIDIGTLKSGNRFAARENLARAVDASGQRLFSDADLEVFDLYFGSEAIRIDSDGQGGFMVINGRHRLYRAQQLGIRSVPVSISNLARRRLSELVAKGEGNR